MGLHPLLLRTDHQEVEKNEQRNEEQQRAEGLGQARNSRGGAGGRLGKAGVANMASPVVNRGAAVRPLSGSPEAKGSPRFCNGTPLKLITHSMTSDLKPVLERIAQALERMAPPPPAPADFSSARLFRHDAAAGVFRSAPDYPLALDSLVGVDRQKERFLENLTRFAAGLPANHVLLWGVRGTGKSSLAKAAFMTAAQEAPILKLVEVDRDEITALPDLFDALRVRNERFPGPLR